ncbi:P-loop NTPase fold protein [Glycocaulis sp.]
MYSAEEAARYLDHYVSPDTKAEYAVMLTGPWGVGKTHFIKSYFESRLETPSRRSSLWPWQNKKKLEPQRRYLYASLYGVSSKNEVLDQFFVQAHPALSSTYAKIGGSIIARFINFRAGTEVNSEKQNHALLTSILLNLKNKRGCPRCLRHLGWRDAAKAFKAHT